MSVFDLDTCGQGAVGADHVRGSCGVFHRRRMREVKGPRGGRQTWWTLECTQCGFRTPELRSKTAGSPTSVEAALWAALRARVCPKPRRATGAAALLARAAAHVRAREAPPLRFVVEFELVDTTVPAALARAWRECASGFAMGQFAVAQFEAVARQGSAPWVSAPRWSQDGAECVVWLELPDLGVQLSGDDAKIADAIRALMPTPPPVAGWTIDAAVTP